MKRYVNWRSGTPAVCANSFTGGGYECSIVILPVMQTRGYMCPDIDSAVRQHSPMLSLFAWL